MDTRDLKLAVYTVYTVHTVYTVYTVYTVCTARIVKYDDAVRSE